MIITTTLPQYKAHNMVIPHSEMERAIKQFNEQCHEKQVLGHLDKHDVPSHIINGVEITNDIIHIDIKVLPSTTGEILDGILSQHLAMSTKVDGFVDEHGSMTITGLSFCNK